MNDGVDDRGREWTWENEFTGESEAQTDQPHLGDVPSPLLPSVMCQGPGVAIPDQAAHLWGGRERACLSPLWWQEVESDTSCDLVSSYQEVDISGPTWGHIGFLVSVLYSTSSMWSGVSFNSVRVYVELF
jgi:hypothetical protein